MDDTLHILRHLYGEIDDEAALRRLLDDDALRAEYEALRDVKERLDSRAQQRPDAAVIDQVVAAARTASRADGLPAAGVKERVDRAPRPRAARRLRWAGAVSTALALLLVVGIGIVQWQAGTQETAVPEAASSEALAPMADQSDASEDADEPLAQPAPPPPVEAEEAPPSMAARREAPAPLAEQEALADAEQRAGRAIARPQGEDAGLAKAADETDKVPAWDETDEVLRLHRRIELLEARSAELNWDESTVMSLDVLPNQNPDARRGLNPAGQQRPPDHR